MKIVFNKKLFNCLQTLTFFHAGMVANAFEFSRVYFGAELARHRATIELLGALSTIIFWIRYLVKIC